MRAIIIGDIHCNKPFSSYHTINNNIKFNKQWWKLTAEYIYKTLMENKSEYDEIIFLGDIFDNINNKNISLYEREFADLLYKINEHIDKPISIIVGNHDTNEPLNEKETPLYLFKTIKNINIYFNYKLIEYNDHYKLFLPYVKKEILLDYINEINKQENINKLDKQLIVISHNDIYLNHNVMNMFTIEEIKEYLSNKKLKVINGHIHQYHYAHPTHLILPGSCSPTQFNIDMMASGICLIDTKYTSRKFLQKEFYNNYIAFLSIDKEDYLDVLEKYCKDSIETNTKLVICYNLLPIEKVNEINKKYNSSIIAYKINAKNKDIKEENVKNYVKNVNIEKISEKINFSENFYKYFNEKYNIMIEEALNSIDIYLKEIETIEQEV